MKLINRNVDYAVRALVYIAEKSPAVVAVSEMEGPVGVPRPFLRKILQVLNKESVLVSRKGKGGGFVLANRPGEIFLKDLMGIFQGPLRSNGCGSADAPCQRHKTCRLRSKMGAIESGMLAEIEKISLKTLINRPV